jgi:hypothetical protein
MPTKSEFEEVPKEDGSTSKKLHVEFTNGSLEQLEDLAKFFDVKGDPSEVVKLAISFLQNVKDRSTAQKDVKTRISCQIPDRSR